MDAVLVVDKSKGITSQKAVNKIKGIFKVKHAGHTGTLDPFATGVLPVCLGNATKIIPFLDEDFKEYEAVLMLGVTTDTLDGTGKILSEVEVGDISEQKVLDAFSKFKGEISQVPPMFSALKRDGVRLYEMARRGEEVERKARQIVIKELRLLELNPPFIRFFVRCSKGTYVRVLGADIAAELGTGGYLAELRRISSGKFNIEDAVSIEDIKPGNVKFISIGDALFNLKVVYVKDGAGAEIRLGKQIRKSYLDSTSTPQFESGDKLKVYEGSELVSIAEAVIRSSELTNLRDRDIVLKLLRVFN